MSKRGDRSLRALLIDGARATVHRAHRETDARSRWIVRLEQRRGQNIATVAIAKKHARIAWALLTSDAEYRKAASGEDCGLTRGEERLRRHGVKRLPTVARVKLE